MTDEYTKAMDEDLSLRLDQVIEDAMDEVNDWIGERVTLEREHKTANGGSQFWAIGYLVAGEPVAWAFDVDQDVALRRARQQGRLWIMREHFPQTLQAIQTASARYVRREFGLEG